MWTPVNIDPRKKNIDSYLGISGLSDLILSKIDDNTYCNLNVCVNGLSKTIPDGYDLYILGFWFEIFDENVFLQVYKNNPTAQFILLTDLSPNGLTNFDAGPAKFHAGPSHPISGQQWPNVPGPECADRPPRAPTVHKSN